VFGKGEFGTRSMQVVIAALNEEEGIGPTIDDLREYLGSPSVLVVDGKSCDHTVEIAKNMGADLVFQEKTGKGNAYSEAFKHLGVGVDYVVLIDADYTYPASAVPEMIKILEENPKVGMVCGNRFNSDLNSRSLQNLFYIGNRFLAFTHNLFNGIALDDPLTGLRVVRAEILRNWQIRSDSFDVEVEMNHHVERKGFTISEVPIKYRERLGEKKLKIVHGATILKRIIAELAYKKHQ